MGSFGLVPIQTAECYTQGHFAIPTSLSGLMALMFGGGGVGWGGRDCITDRGVLFRSTH